MPQSLLTYITLLLIVLCAHSPLSAQDKSEAPKIFLVDDFDNETVDDLPEKWFNQKGEAKPITYTGDLRATYHYRIMEEEGNMFLRFEGKRGKHLSFPLRNKEHLDIYETPILTWKWRIHEYPAGANEDDGDKNDAAASIYVAFDLGRVLFKKVPKSIRYTWSSTLPKGTELSKFYGNQKIIVIGTGGDKQGEWQTFERDIVADYKRLFGDNPPAKPLAILILSDANNTEDIAKADYDDIYLKSAQN
jgi:hypothetical protein